MSAKTLARFDTPATEEDTTLHISGDLVIHYACCGKQKLSVTSLADALRQYESGKENLELQGYLTGRREERGDHGVVFGAEGDAVARISGNGSIWVPKAGFLS